jgi:hypothetical protein
MKSLEVLGLAKGLRSWTLFLVEALIGRTIRLVVLL